MSVKNRRHLITHPDFQLGYDHVPNNKREDRNMLVVLIVSLALLPTAVKRMVASGYTRGNATIIWLLCVLLMTGAGFVLFGPI